MFDLSSYDISLNTNPFIITVGLLLLAFYTYFIYKFTIPALSPLLKYSLSAIRALAIGLLFVLIFEPIVSRNLIETIEPSTYVFIDNSASMIQNDSANVVHKIERAIGELNTNLDGSVKYFSFGNSVNEITSESVASLPFNERFTDYSEISDYVEESIDNITRVVLISDGIITTGTNPLKSIEDRSIPYSIVGVGDSSKIVDASVKELITNNYLYTNKETTVEAVILNSGFTGQPVEVRFRENNKLIASEVITLNSSGINRVEFNYLPGTSGEKKLQVSVSPLQTDSNISNNTKTTFRNVTNSKLRIGLVSDSPSSDMGFIKQSLKQNEDYEVVDFITADGSKALAPDNWDLPVDSINIFFLIGFPTSNSNSSLVNKITTLINNNSVPFFLMVTTKTDLQKLNNVFELLPFNLVSSKVSFTKAQLEVLDIFNPLLQINSKFDKEMWSNLSPVFTASSGVIAKPGSNVIAGVRLKNIPTGLPLLISKSAGKTRNITLLAEEIWRWKLNNNEDQMFDQFISNITSWLKADPDKKRFSVSLPAREFSFGEELNFTAELYDEKLSPIDDAEISITLSYDEFKKDLYLLNKGNGTYGGATTASMTGDVFYMASAYREGIEIGAASGRLLINEMEIEKSNTQMNKELLRNIALVSGGLYYDDTDNNELAITINNSNEGKIIQNKLASEFKLWAHEYTLMFIILLLSAEWFLRKRNGMI